MTTPESEPGISARQRGVNEALRAIGALFEPGDVIEMRALEVGRTEYRAGVTYAGYFNFENKKAIEAAIRWLDGRAEGIYVALNRLNPVLLARASNRIQRGLKHTTSDADIVARRWLYIDADAVRPAGISATDAEHSAALERIAVINQCLTHRGWPEPISADSGNGGHLLYRLPELHLDFAAELVKKCLRALAARFTDTVVKIDESTATAARICKLYGTLTRKGDPTPDRPHRRARIIHDPELIVPVPLELLKELAAEVRAMPVRASGREMKTSTPGRFSIDHWLETSGLDVIKGPEPYSGGRRWILRVCPFNRQHEKPAVLELSGGALVYSCLHRSCDQNDWTALRELIEPSYQQQKQRADASGPPPAAKSNATVETASFPLITKLSQLPSIWTLEAKLDWSVEEMVAQGSITLISSESGTGKTWLGYFIAGRVAHGREVLGRAVRRSRVLYLDGENPLCVVKQRLWDLGIQETPDLTIWGGWNISAPPPPQSPLIVEFAREHKGLIIYDSLIEFHPGSEQSSTETRAFMRHFRFLANLGATVVILHHSGKAETAKLYRGSSDIKAAVDTAYLLEKPADEVDRLGRLSLTCFKGRLAPGQNFGMEFRKGEGFVARDTLNRTRSTKEVVTEILTAWPGSNQKQIVTIGRTKGCSKKQLEDCLRDGPWRRQRGQKNSLLYWLPGENSDAGTEDF